MTRQTIVVVEDEPAQRIGAAAMFADHGFDTAEFENADEAGAYVRQNEDKVLAVSPMFKCRATPMASISWPRSRSLARPLRCW